MNKIILILFSTLMITSCASAPDRTAVITGEQNWSIAVGQFTGSFIFTVKNDGSFEGISQWSGGSGGISNKIKGYISNSSFVLTRYLEGRHIGKTQSWRGILNSAAKSASGAWSGTGGRGYWAATIK